MNNLVLSIQLKDEAHLIKVILSLAHQFDILRKNFIFIPYHCFKKLILIFMFVVIMINLQINFFIKSFIIITIEFIYIPNLLLLIFF